MIKEDFHVFFQAIDASMLEAIKKMNEDIAMALTVKTNPNQTGYSHHLSSEPVKGTVSVSTKVGGKEKEEHTEHVLNKGVFTDKYTGMKVSVSGGRTLNLGNYESARVDVSITVPCEADSANEAYEYASDFVSEKINEAVKIAKGE